MTDPATAPAPTEICWRKELAEYARPRLGRSLLDLATSVVPYLMLSVAMFFALRVSGWLTLALAVPASGFLLRTFIVFHDCSHGSFLPSKRANHWLGIALGLLVYAPFLSWRHDHAVHHATSGDLDRRGVGDLPTLTVREFRSRDWRSQLGYRMFRHPLVMFGIGPVWALVLSPRLISRRKRWRLRRAVYATNVALAVLVGLLCWLMGPLHFLLVQGPAVIGAGTAGVWLFYVQHQFEDMTWHCSGEWSYDDAALKGSSYLRLPRVLQFFSGNIGLHHVHHLNARIPNYNLQRAHDENPVFHSVPVLTLRDGLRATRLKLWCEERGRLVSFREANLGRRAALDTAAPPA